MPRNNKVDLGNVHNFTNKHKDKKSVKCKFWLQLKWTCLLRWRVRKKEAYALPDLEDALSVSREENRENRV